MRHPLRSVVLLLLVVANAAVAAGQPKATENPTDLEYGYRAGWSPFQLGFLDVYQLFAWEVPIRGLSFGVLSTWDRSVDGVAVAPIYNSASRQRGAMLAGICNRSEEQKGVALTAIVNRTSARDGLAVAGICNVADGADDGSEPGAEKAAKRSRGIFLAGLTNVDRSDSSGAQVTFGLNVLDRFEGVSVAGLTNYLSTGRGLQLAGIYNKAEVMDGLRVAGVVNECDARPADQSRTVQLAGVSNIVTDSQHGVLARSSTTGPRRQTAAFRSLPSTGRRPPAVCRWGSSTTPPNLPGCRSAC